MTSIIENKSSPLLARLYNDENFKKTKSVYETILSSIQSHAIPDFQ